MFQERHLNTSSRRSNVFVWRFPSHFAIATCFWLTWWVVWYSWHVRLPMTKTPLERTWLYHEMGRCHFELGNYERARELGERSYQEATSARDKVWLLSSSILIAQALGQSPMHEVGWDRVHRTYFPISAYIYKFNWNYTLQGCSGNWSETHICINQACSLLQPDEWGRCPNMRQDDSSQATWSRLSNQNKKTL